MGTTKKISTLIEEIKHQQYFLPEFQRGFVWTADKIRLYFDSLYRNYPTGTFLIWECRKPPKIRGDVPNNLSYMKLILDGQQRLTTLYSIINGSPPPWFEGKEIRTDLYFNIEKKVFSYYLQSTMKGKREWVQVKEVIEHKIGYVKKFGGENRAYLYEHDEILMKLCGILDYEYQLQEIHEQNLEEVVKIFNLVNSQGTTLSQADLSLAVVCQIWDDCKDKMRKAQVKYKNMGFDFSKNFFTRCIAVVGNHRGKFDDIHKLSSEELIATWEKIEKSIDYLIPTLVEHAYIDSTSTLNTQQPLFPIIYYLTQNEFRFPNEETRGKFIYWLYQALLWGRYSSSSDTMVERDIHSLKEHNDVQRLIETIQKSRGGNLQVSDQDLELQSARGRFYQVVYAMIRSNGTIDWEDNALSLYSRDAKIRDSIEKFFIFPKKELYKHYKSSDSYNQKLVNEIANMVFLSKLSTHKNLKKLPETYLADIDANQLRRQYIPVEPVLWTVKNYEEFLKVRRKLLSDGMNAFVEKFYSGNNREFDLDAKRYDPEINNVEKAIRNVIADVYNKNIEDLELHEFLPKKLHSKITSRMNNFFNASNPNGNRKEQSIEKALSFFDVTDLLGVISKKENWPYFQPVFHDAALVRKRFDQFKSLRNPLKHSGEITNIIIKDGEAAILWFGEALREYML